LIDNGKTEAPLTVEIYADGSCKGNPGPGGYCAILRYGEHEKEVCGCEANTTNNRMELTAVIEALRMLKRPCRVRIVTDSDYVVKGMTSWIHKWREKQWKNAQGKAVANRELWEELLELSSGHSIEWEWIKGHNGHPENERCDRIAKEAIERCSRRGPQAQDESRTV
jgi:ribonuclease HI